MTRTVRIDLAYDWRMSDLVTLGLELNAGLGTGEGGIAGRRVIDPDEERAMPNRPIIGLANPLAETGRFEEAENHFRRALKIRHQSFPSNHPLTAALQASIASSSRPRSRSRSPRSSPGLPTARPPSTRPARSSM